MLFGYLHASRSQCITWTVDFKVWQADNYFVQDLVSASNLSFSQRQTGGCSALWLECNSTTTAVQRGSFPQPKGITFISLCMRLWLNNGWKVLLISESHTVHGLMDGNLLLWNNLKRELSKLDVVPVYWLQHLPQQIYGKVWSNKGKKRATREINS